MPDDVTEVLGRVAAGLPGGGETRPGQAEMARAVEAAISDRRHLLVQAGTGTGKSLAYLVPSVLAGEPVVVATATKALQDQLAEKDLPAIASVVDGFSWAVLKGRSNYLCRQRAAEAVVTEATLDLGGPGGGEPGGGGPRGLETGQAGDAGSSGPGGGIGDQVERLLSWAETSATGDRAELDFEPHPRAWSAVSVGARECPGAYRCPSGGHCFAEQARARAAAADVVVVNTHLYAAHVASGGAVLPPHRIVVFDEAHEVEDIMTAGLGTEIGPRRFANLAATARPLLATGATPGTGRAGSGRDDRSVQDVTELADAFTRSLRPLVGTRITGGGGGHGGGRSGGGGRAGLPEGLELRAPAGPGLGPGLGSDPLPDDPGTGAGGPSIADLVTLAAGRLAELIGALDRRAREEREEADDDPDRRARHDRVRLAASNLADDVAHLAASGDDEVVWVDGDAGAPVLRISPVEVGPTLADRLWGEVTGVLTSATLPVGLPGRLGLPDDTTDGPLDVGSPFDYRRNALLYVPRHLPDRRTPEAEAAIHDELEVLIRAAGGRTLALFTSRRAMAEAARALARRLPYPVLSQADLPKPALVAAFRSDEPACLFATLGFFQGVDVPGKTLSLVTIDRIPFPRPDAPVLQARRERAGSGAFRVIDLPRAGTLLAQGAGRLIRSAGDRGVVAVLDSRLATASYRDVLLASVPPMRRVTDRAVVVEFLQDHVARSA